MASQGAATSGVTFRSGNWFWVSGTRGNILDYLELFDPQVHKIAAFTSTSIENDFILLLRK